MGRWLSVWRRVSHTGVSTWVHTLRIHRKLDAGAHMAVIPALTPAERWKVQTGKSKANHRPASLACTVRKKGEAGRPCPKYGGRQAWLILAGRGIQMFEFTQTNAHTYIPHTHCTRVQRQIIVATIIFSWPVACFFILLTIFEEHRFVSVGEIYQFVL